MSRGHVETVRREYEVLMGAGTFADFRVEAEQIVDAGRRMVVIERLAGRGLKGSDAPRWVQETFARVIAFKDDRIWRAKEYRTRAEALEAVGLPSQ